MLQKPVPPGSRCCNETAGKPACPDCAQGLPCPGEMQKAWLFGLALVALVIGVFYWLTRPAGS